MVPLDEPPLLDTEQRCADIVFWIVAAVRMHYQVRLVLQKLTFQVQTSLAGAETGDARVEHL